MTYVVTENCIRCKYTDCVDVCPVEAFHEGPNFVVINPDECIDCDVCRETAPNNFRANEDEGYSYVVKQPETEEERSLCEEARDSCPVEAIGDDG